MLIGEDYPKIEFELFGLHLVEPNAFIGDVIIFSLAIYFYNKINKLRSSNETPFLKNWSRFYLWFGLSFLAGGFGHLLFNYTGVPGKIPSWIIGMFAPFFIEQAMISIYPKIEKRNLFSKISLIKLVVFLLAESIVLLTVDISDAPEKGLILPTISSTVGLLICLGILGSSYQKHIHPSFKFLWISMFILILSALPQALKINPSQYFDRNDISHVFLLTALVLYYQTIRNYRKFHISSESLS